MYTARIIISNTRRVGGGGRSFPRFSVCVRWPNLDIVRPGKRHNKLTFSFWRIFAGVSQISTEEVLIAFGIILGKFYYVLIAHSIFFKFSVEIKKNNWNRKLLVFSGFDRNAIWFFYWNDMKILPILCNKTMIEYCFFNVADIYYFMLNKSCLRTIQR